ncbi:MOSC domain-containing protein [Cerasicoccus frondis]|uniref:MOSC domain-containing protein n=1 Tax=Cerasicoccus frondis TaxID=490090 RepID=UPI002852872F|nr:MOSC domain-containing protein [Cerasicoccus frondis]
MLSERTMVKVMAIWISPGHDFRGRHGLGREDHGVVKADFIDCHAGKGIAGDRYYDYKPDYKGQLTFFDEAVARKLELAFQLPTLDRSLFRRNVLLNGVDLNSLIGREFRMGDVVFSGSEECSPCYWMDEAVTPGAFEWLKGRGGLRVRILESGKLSLGEQTLEVLS